MQVYSLVLNKYKAYIKFIYLFNLILNYTIINTVSCGAVH